MKLQPRRFPPKTLPRDQPPPSSASGHSKLWWREIIVGLVSGAVVAAGSLLSQSRIDDQRLEREAFTAKQMADEADRRENLRFVRDRASDDSSVKPFMDLDLSGQSLRGLMLDKANFNGALLNRSQFTSSSLKGSNFREAMLVDSVFVGADLSDESNFAYVLAARANFNGAALTKANFMQAFLPNVNFIAQNWMKPSYFLPTSPMRAWTGQSSERPLSPEPYLLRLP